MNEHLDDIIRFVSSANLSKLPNGRTEVDGNNAFLNVTDVKYLPVDSAPYEIHRSYADIHISIEGDEKVAWLAEGKVQIPEGKDDAVLTEHYEPELTIPLRKGYFLLIMPGEPHAPAIGVDAGRKIIAKVNMAK